MFTPRLACKKHGANVLTLVSSSPAAKILHCKDVWPRWLASSITCTPLNRLPRNGSVFASAPGTRSTPARYASALSSMPTPSWESSRSAASVLRCWSKICSASSSGGRETARRVDQIYKQIFEFAEAAGITPPNQIGNLSRTLPELSINFGLTGRCSAYHYKAAFIEILLREIDSNRGAIA